MALQSEAMEIRDMVDIYVTGRKQITNIYIKIDDYTKELLDAYIRVRKDEIIEDNALKVAPDQVPTFEIALDLTLEESDEKVVISSCCNKCPGDIIVGIRCLNGVTRITKGDGGLKIPAKTLCSPTHFKLNGKEVLKFTGKITILSLLPNGRNFHGTFSIYTKSSYKKRKESLVMDSWNLGVEKKMELLENNQRKKRQRQDKSLDSPLDSPRSSPGTSIAHHQLYSKSIPVFTSKATIVPPTGPHHAHTAIEIRGFNSGGGAVNLLWKEGDNIMILEPIDIPSESKLCFHSPYGRPGLVIEVWIRVDGSYFIGDTQGNPFKFTYDYSPDPALNEVLKIVQNLEKSVMQLSDARQKQLSVDALGQAMNSKDGQLNELERHMESLKDEMKKKTAQLAQYGTFISPLTEEHLNREKAAKEASKILPMQLHQTEIIKMTKSEPINLNLDDIITLEVKPMVRSVRFININVSDDIKDLVEGPNGPASIQLDEVLLEPGTKHLLNMAPDYRFSLFISKDAETDPLEVSRCVEPNCEGRLLKRKVAVVPTTENIIRLALRGTKLQIPIQFFCSPLHFNGDKFNVKIQFLSTKTFRVAYTGVFTVWTNDKYLIEQQKKTESFDHNTPLAMLGQAVMDIEEKVPQEQEIMDIEDKIIGSSENGEVSSTLIPIDPTQIALESIPLDAPSSPRGDIPAIVS